MKAVINMRTRDWLKKKRNEKGITQKELATEVGLSTSTIMLIEEGQRLGSANTWELLEQYFCANNELEKIKDKKQIINNLVEDINMFGKNALCLLLFKTKNNTIIFENYIVYQNIIDKKEKVRNGQKYIETKLIYALKIFKEQYNIKTLKK